GPERHPRRRGRRRAGLRAADKMAGGGLTPPPAPLLSGADAVCWAELLVAVKPPRRPVMSKTAHHAARAVAVLLAAWLVPAARAAEPTTEERHFLYVVAPGIRNYLEFGGAGVLVFDMDKGHAFVKRIDTPASQLDKPENIKGV